MDIYLLRHAIAVPSGTPGYPNDDRPLTKEGRKKMEKAAQGIKALGLEVGIILTSPLIRAADTAQIVAAAMGWEDRIKIFTPLLPGTPARTIIEKLNPYRAEKSLLLVGHEPNLSELAATLLHVKGLDIRFKKGGLCHIEVVEGLRQPGTLLWHLTPDQLRLMGKGRATAGE